MTSFSHCVASRNRTLLQSHGFFKVTRKAFWVPTCKRKWETVVRFIRAKAKDCPQVPRVSSTTRWLSSTLCGRSPASGAISQHPCQSGPAGPGPRDTELSWVSFLHLHVYHKAALGPTLGPVWLLHRECAWANKQTHQAVVKLSLYYLRLGKEQAFFQTNRCLSWLCAFVLGPPPIQSLSWIFWGFTSWTNPHLFPG